VAFVSLIFLTVRVHGPYSSQYLHPSKCRITDVRDKIIDPRRKICKGLETRTFHA